MWNSIFWGTIFSILIFAIPLIFVDKYRAFFGQDVEFYRIYVIYGTTLSILIISPYCTEIGQFVQGGLMFITLIIIRITKFKVVDNKLIVKQKAKE